MHTFTSILGNIWEVKDCDDRYSMMISQRHNISELLAKLLSMRNIKDDEVDSYLNPKLLHNLPQPYHLLDMKKSVERTYKALINNEFIAIIADYDVDGSTSAAILYKFFKHLNKQIFLEIPNRLKDGYGPNHFIMDKFLKNNINLLFTLDCGTSSFDILENKNYKSIDTIIIDHHISENNLPKVFSIINPNRFDESGLYKDISAVGVTFIFLLVLRKFLRENDYFKLKNINEPNLSTYLDLVALGTVCDVVNLRQYNRAIVHKGIEIIHKRLNKGISKIIDNSITNHSPTVSDLGYIIGPQLNAASRMDDSSLSVKILISDNIIEIENISKRLLLLNEKRKLIENSILKEAVEQAFTQSQNNIIIVKGNFWHNGVLGIVASRLVEKFNKPAIVISFHNSFGQGSARSIKNIDLGNTILNAKKEGLLISGGGHKMAAGLKVSTKLIKKFEDYLIKKFNNYDQLFFRKIHYYDLIITLEQVNLNLIENIEKMEPFGKGNQEPKFIIKEVIVEHIKIIKEKHILVFIRDNFNNSFKAVCFNCVNNELGENFLKSKIKKFDIACTIKRDNFSSSLKPQIIIQDAIINN